MLKQAGASLIEFMIASAIGTFALGLVGSLYISGQKSMMDRSKELMLLQNTASVLDMLKADLHRAGYDGKQGFSVKLSGASDTVYTLSAANGSMIAYAYYIDVVATQPRYKHVIVKQKSINPSALYLCEKKQTTIMDVSAAINVSGCFKLFDDSLIKVTTFEASQSVVASAKAKSTRLTITLRAELFGVSDIHSEQSFSVMQRNWQ